MNQMCCEKKEIILICTLFTNQNIEFFFCQELEDQVPLDLELKLSGISGTGSK